MTDPSPQLLVDAELFTENPEEAIAYYEWLLGVRFPDFSNPEFAPAHLPPAGAEAGWVPRFLVPSVDAAITAVQPLGAHRRDTEPARGGKHYAISDDGLWAGITEHVPHGVPSITANVDCATHTVERTSRFLQTLLSAEPLDTLEDPYDVRVIASDRHVASMVLRMRAEMNISTRTTWIVYFTAHDIVSTVSRANEAGSRVLVPPVSSPFDRYAILRDPWGQMFGLSAPFDESARDGVLLRDASGRTAPATDFIDLHVE